MKYSGIMVAGSVLVDKINTISAYPKIGELTQIHKVELSVGGCVPNVAIDLKKIDPNLAVWAVGRIGQDDEGQFLSKTLQENGVNTDYLSHSPEKTSFTEVMSIHGGQRTFFCHAGASAGFGLSDIPWNVKPAILHLGYFLLLEKIDTGEGLRILKQAKIFGIKTSIDMVSENSDRYNLILPCLPYTDYLIINELEASKLTGMDTTDLTAMGQKLLQLGVREMVILHMPEKCVCCSRQGTVTLGSHILPEDYIQGTTGAGDAFCAGALWAIYKNLPPEEILSFATSCATVSLRTPDATGGLCNKKKIEALCRGYQRREEPL